MLQLISFVGVDARTDIMKLVQLERASKVPLEFGVLYSEGRAGKESRYPTYNESLGLLNLLCNNNLMASLHLCGQGAIDKFLEGDSVVLELANLASRIQLNFNIKNYDLNELADKLNVISQDRTLIIQNNKTKSEFVELLKKKDAANTYSECSERYNFLFDASGGVGKEISKFETWDEHYFTGYAGGIKPDNVASILEGIHKANLVSVFGRQMPIGYYIDMESGVRVDDWFDVPSCKSVVETCNEFLTSEGWVS